MTELASADIRAVIRSQFHAALDMYEAAVDAIPDEAWDRDEDRNRTWHLAYHTLFFVHLYLQRSEADFEPWEGHREHYDHMGHLPWPPPGEPELAAPLGREKSEIVLLRS